MHILFSTLLKIKIYLFMIHKAPRVSVAHLIGVSLIIRIGYQLDLIKYLLITLILIGIDLVPPDNKMLCTI